MLKRSWIEINLKTIQNNYNIYRSLIPLNQEIMGVVKADGYGHGQNRIAAVLQSCGCRNFAVSNLEEAILLRQSGITGQILVLGYTPPSVAEDLLKNDITQAILSKEYAEAMKGKGIKAHFAIDTGMNRIGLDADVVEDCSETICKYSSSFVLTGIFTHLSVADTPSEDAFTQEQLKKIQKIADAVSHLKLPYIHCMNSAVGLWQKPYGTMVRLGIILYGLKPDYYNILPPGIKPAVQWKSVVSMVKRVHKGESVGYGRNYRAERDIFVATIPTGYADGYNRMLSNKGTIVIHGRKASVIGRICMDQIMVDVTEIPETKMGDDVLLLGKDYNADDMAKDIGTIGYEVMCNISKRVPREYI